MKMYFYSNTEKSNSEQNLYSVIFSFFQARGYILLSNKNPDEIRSFSLKIKNTYDNKSLLPLDYMDGFIIEQGNPNDEMEFLIMHALSQKKPILFLTSINPNSAQDRLYEFLLFESNKKDLIKIKNYTLQNIDMLLDNFLLFTNDLLLHDDNLIKFTLRMSQGLSTKFTQACKIQKKQKAALLREIITHYIAKAPFENKKNHPAEPTSSFCEDVPLPGDNQ